MDNLFDKAAAMADRYYNRALQHGQDGELSLCINCLEASLRIDKGHVSARNLLGLAYYAVGKTGEALRQWHINLEYDAAGAARGYINRLKGPQLEKLSQAAALYNEALVYIKKNSEDLALIRLKRAIELNPSFVEAMNLLALAYMRQDDKLKARGMTARALSIDASNPMANRLAKSFKKPPRNREDAPPVKDNADERHRPQAKGGIKPKKSRLTVSGILSFAIGIGAMFLFMYFLVFPGILSDRDEELANLEGELMAQGLAQADLLSQHAESITNLNQTIAEITAQSDNQARQLALLENEQLVFSAHFYFQQELYPEALTQLNAVDHHWLEQLSLETMAMYDLVRTESSGVVEALYFQQGQALFNQNNLEDAMTALEHAAAHSLHGSELTDDIFYYLGRVAEASGDYALARIYYENIINNFQDGNRATLAYNRLNNLP